MSINYVCKRLGLEEYQLILIGSNFVKLTINPYSKTLSADVIDKEIIKNLYRYTRTFLNLYSELYESDRIYNSIPELKQASYIFNYDLHKGLEPHKALKGFSKEQMIKYLYSFNYRHCSRLNTLEVHFPIPHKELKLNSVYDRFFNNIDKGFELKILLSKLLLENPCKTDKQIINLTGSGKAFIANLIKEFRPAEFIQTHKEFYPELLNYRTVFYFGNSIKDFQDNFFDMKVNPRNYTQLIYSSDLTENCIKDFFEFQISDKESKEIKDLTKNFKMTEQEFLKSTLGFLAEYLYDFYLANHY